jgi:hypothetical protein
MGKRSSNADADTKFRSTFPTALQPNSVLYHPVGEVSGSPAIRNTPGRISQKRIISWSQRPLPTQHNNNNDDDEKRLTFLPSVGFEPETKVCRPTPSTVWPSGLSLEVCLQAGMNKTGNLDP